MKNGFTLIEVVIVLFIIVIAGSMIGSLTVFSLQMSSDATVENSEKQMVDRIVETIEYDLSTATVVCFDENGEVPIIKNESGEDLTWNELCIKDDKIYRNGDKLFNDNFYGRKKIAISVSIAEDNVKITVTSYTNEKISYESMAVISLDNRLYENTICIDEELKDNAKLFYNKEMSLTSTLEPEEPEEPEEEEKPPSGTIEDYLAGLDTQNNFGVFPFLGTQSIAMKKGSFVFNPQDGYWYQVLQDAWLSSDSFNGNNGGILKRIDPYFNTSTHYFPGDVIIYNDAYYRCKQSVAHGWPVPDDKYNGIYYWEKLEKAPDEFILSTVVYEESEEPLATLMDQLKEDKEKYYVGIYDEEKDYKIGDVVAVKYEAKYGPDCYVYYKKVFDYNCNPGEKDENGKVAWMRYSKQFTENSAYEKGAIVSSYWSDNVIYQQYLRDVDEPKTAMEFYFYTSNPYQQDVKKLR